MSEQKWFRDENGNKCSAEYFGSEEKAKEALASLVDCDNCTNCSDCSRCSDCSDCSRCSRCSDCSDCSRCSDCSDCSRCSDCSDCSRCSDCSGCSRCSDCSHVAFLDKKEGLLGDPSVTNEPGVPPIPKIENIHQRVYEAVSQPNALHMGGWHSCETTHCRAGWVVHLAGKAGYALEQFHNPELAAMLIYRESGYHINPARFYDSNEAALADMKRLAEQE